MGRITEPPWRPRWRLVDSVINFNIYIHCLFGYMSESKLAIVHAGLIVPDPAAPTLTHATVLLSGTNSNTHTSSSRKATGKVAKPGKKPARPIVVTSESIGVVLEEEELDEVVEVLLVVLVPRVISGRRRRSPPISTQKSSNMTSTRVSSTIFILPAALSQPSIPKGPMNLTFE